MFVIFCFLYDEFYKLIFSKKLILVLFLYKKGCLLFEYLCVIILNICCLENVLSN